MIRPQRFAAGNLPGAGNPLRVCLCGQAFRERIQLRANDVEGVGRVHTYRFTVTPRAAHPRSAAFEGISDTQPSPRRLLARMVQNRPKHRAAAAEYLRVAATLTARTRKRRCSKISMAGVRRKAFAATGFFPS